MAGKIADILTNILVKEVYHERYQESNGLSGFV